jgi:branched-chain amino acid transport system ATP-binding protein
MATEQGTAVLLVEQTVDVALAVSDRAYVMRQGRIVMSGPANEIADDRTALESQYLGQTTSGVLERSG